MEAAGHSYNGVPAGMVFFLGTTSLLAAIGDLRIIREGSLRGARRLARHLWRMCFGLFIATGSFFFGQAKFIPAPIRIGPLLSVLGVAPLVILLYWIWRVRLRRRLTGIIVCSMDSARVTAHCDDVNSDVIERSYPSAQWFVTSRTRARAFAQ